MLQPESDLQRLTTEANEAIDVGAFDRLIFLARQMLSEDPTNSTAWSYLGVALSERGEHSEALEKHRNAITYDRQSAVAWKNYAVGLTMAGDFSLALAAAKSSVELDNLNFDGWRLLVECHLHLGLLEEADDVLDDLFRRFRKLPERLGIRIVRSDRQFSTPLLLLHLERASSKDFALRSPDIKIEGFGETLGEAFTDFSQACHAVFVDFKGDLRTASDEQLIEHAASRVARMQAATEETESDEDLMAEIAAARADHSPAVSLEQLRGA